MVEVSDGESDPSTTREAEEGETIIEITDSDNDEEVTASHPPQEQEEQPEEEPKTLQCQGEPQTEANL